jgi:hypothetical protein
VKIEKCHYFYTSLFLALLLSRLKKAKPARSEREWPYAEKHVITVVTRQVLNMDFWINKTLDKIGVHPPGLSLIAICRKKA